MKNLFILQDEDLNVFQVFYFDSVFYPLQDLLKSFQDKKFIVLDHSLVPKIPGNEKR